MSKEKDKILRILEHIAITFDKLGFSPTVPICTGHKDFNYLFRLEIDTVKELCDQQDQRIAELEEKLKNAIVPKFKIGQEVWFISMTNYVCNFIIQELQYTLCCDGRSGICYFSKDNLEEYEWNLFATKEEAQAKLEELQGENK